ncbi:exopolysaccharide biosynthesis protein [Sphingomonas parva]|uniref:Exopolysaccharide biosynthesis protein n=1 Tax=Sphingomonas parva TaxID=2555898 RepID=A0A4Y8ZQA1_9SPHN|nr:AAA family ATPase [Sphingomonas parva]TFI58188.1 exopolysaccharide biosynthesis protein [Sphingomonas parva]
MNDQTPLRTGGSLLERAAELYGFGIGAGAPAAAPAQTPVATTPRPEPELAAPRPQPAPRVAPEAVPVRDREPAAGEQAIDRARLQEGGFIDPDAPGGPLTEEFRIVKRQLLRGIEEGGETARTILVCSANPDEGKTFCALNLALSLAAERDLEVLLVDGDFPKPEILSTLGLEGEAGLIDALADPSIDPEDLIIRTDVPGLSVLPAGRRVAEVPELLASERTRGLLARLSDPRRIILFDTPPALMASPATVLASHAGQLLMVVRADQTTEADLREAVGLLSGCENVRLLLNGTGFAVTGRRFGSYYGYGQ